MTEAEYQKGRERALPVLRNRGYTPTLVDDAIQAAALYFLERDYAKVTPALFTYYAVRRARDLYEAAYGSTRPHGKVAREIHVGSAQELVEFEAGGPPVYTGVEDNE